MSNLEHGLGGRLPLLEPEKLQSKQRELYGKINSGVVPLAAAAGFEGRDEQGHLIGPFNATLYSPEICGSFLALQKIEEEQTTLSKRTRQVVILTVGSVWKAPYELYAHSAVAAKVGLTKEQIDSLVSGQIPYGLNEDELLAQGFTYHLVSEHTVNGVSYAATREVFGDRGLVEMLVLIGCYLSVCALLNAFAVPAPKAMPKTNNEDPQ
jgi:4-carboxymuconolactone decarboxylase